MPLTWTLLMSSTSNSNNVLKTQPVCNLYEITGTTWKDLTNNNNNFTLYNSPVVSFKNITFNGTSTYGHLSTFTKTLASNFSVFVWIKTTSTDAYIWQTGRNISTIINQGNFRISGGKLNFWDWNNTFGFSFDNVSTNTINDGNWHLIGFVKNGTSGTYYLDGYLNGTTVASLNITYNLSDTCVGKDFRDGVSFLNGTIGQLLIYNSSLSASNVKKLYNYYINIYHNVSTTNLIQWYDSSLFSGTTTLIDKSGGSRNAVLYNNGTPSNSNVTIVDVSGNKYLYFNGNAQTSGGYIYYPTNLVNSLISSSYNQTQEVWFRNVNSSNVVQSNAGIIITEQGNAYPFNTGWHDSQIEIYGGRIKMRVWNSSTLDVGDATSGNWLHIAWRYTSTGVLDGFLNGKKTVSISVSRVKPSDNGAGYYSVIGYYDTTNLSGSPSNGYYYKGYIAKYRNYNASLSDDTIYRNYLAEKGFFNPHPY
jgi:hypothetical protein